jgi:formiminotetrahydrofolate cyclodeaminase
MKAYKQAKSDPANADGVIDAALKLATGVPLDVAEKAYQVSHIAQSLFAITNPNMKSDLTTAQALARAAITGALANVEINLASLKDQAFVADVRDRVRKIDPAAVH